MDSDARTTQRLEGHSETRTTKGKDLDCLAEGAMTALKIDFKYLIKEYLES